MEKSKPLVLVLVLESLAGFRTAPEHSQLKRSDTMPASIYLSWHRRFLPCYTQKYHKKTPLMIQIILSIGLIFFIIIQCVKNPCHSYSIINRALSTLFFNQLIFKNLKAP